MIGGFFNPILQGGTAASMDVDFVASTQSTNLGVGITFSNLSDPTPIFNFWEFGDGSFSTASTPNKSYSATGTFSVKLHAVDNVSGGIETKTDYINISFAFPQDGLVLLLNAINYNNTNTWIDSSTYSNDFTLRPNYPTDSPVYTSSGVSSYFNFNGSTQYMDVSNNSSLNPTTGITILTWFNLDTLAINQNIISKGFTSFAAPFVQYSLKMNDTSPANKLQFNIAAGGALRTVNSNTTLSDSTWYLGVGVYNKSQMRIWINGVLDGASTNQTNDLNTYNTPLNIGRWETGNIQYLDGSVNLAAIYNRALTSTEIEAIWNNTKGRFGY